jgi:hypothetical protein
MASFQAKKDYDSAPQFDIYEDPTLTSRSLASLSTLNDSSVPKLQHSTPFASHSGSSLAFSSHTASNLSHISHAPSFNMQAMAASKALSYERPPLPSILEVSREDRSSLSASTASRQSQPFTPLSNPTPRSRDTHDSNSILAPPPVVTADGIAYPISTAVKTQSLSKVGQKLASMREVVLQMDQMLPSLAYGAILALSFASVQLHDPSPLLEHGWIASSTGLGEENSDVTVLLGETPCPWEFHIATSARERIARLPAPQARAAASVARASATIVYKNGCVTSLAISDDALFKELHALNVKQARQMVSVFS